MFHHYENPSNLNLHLNYLRWLKPIKIYTSYSLHFLQSIMIISYISILFCFNSIMTIVINTIDGGFKYEVQRGLKIHRTPGMEF